MFQLLPEHLFALAQNKHVPMPGDASNSSIARVVEQGVWIACVINLIRVDGD